MSAHPTASYRPHRILIPIDGTPLSQAAIPATLAIAPQPAAITLLHVVDDHGLAGLGTIDRIETLATELRGSLPGCAVEIAIAHGDPATEILDAATGMRPDLVVMATRDFLAASQPAAGTVSARVARSTSLPVLVTHGTAGEWRPKRVVVPLDGSLRALQALPIAAGLTATLRIPAHLIAVIDPTVSLPPAYAWSCPACDPDLQDALTYLQCQANDLLNQAERRLAAAGVTVTSDLLLGRTGPTLLGAIEQDDVVVMTTRGAGRHDVDHLGSIATRLLRESPAPVVVFHPRLATTITHNPLATDWESVIPTPHLAHR